jgi:hypothetical protein
MLTESVDGSVSLDLRESQSPYLESLSSPEPVPGVPSASIQ